MQFDGSKSSYSSLEAGAYTKLKHSKSPFHSTRYMYNQHKTKSWSKQLIILVRWTLNSLMGASVPEHYFLRNAFLFITQINDGCIKVSNSDIFSDTFRWMVISLPDGKKNSFYFTYYDEVIFLCDTISGKMCRLISKFIITGKSMYLT